MRFALLLVIACGQPTRFPETRWESAPPPPKPAPPPKIEKVESPSTLGMRAAPRPREVAKRIEDKLARTLAAARPSPYHECPTGDMSMAVARTLPVDARGAFASQHRQPVRRSELLDRETAIKRVLAIEAAQPVVVPAAFRKDLVTYGRNPEFRLHMARCELAHPQSIRRAGYDAALAVLLGAAPEVALPLIDRSVFPDGPTTTSCRANADCSGTCDAVTRECTSPRRQAANMLSRAELDIEDVLVRAFAIQLTKEQLERERYVPGNLVELWTFGRYAKCGDALCNLTRYDVDGKPRLVYWDRRDRGEAHDRAEQPWEVCHRETSSTTRGGCIAKCEGPQRATCVATCTSLCPIEAPSSPGTDDD